MIAFLRKSKIETKVFSEIRCSYDYLGILMKCREELVNSMSMEDHNRMNTTTELTHWVHRPSGHSPHSDGPSQFNEVASADPVK